METVIVTTEENEARKQAGSFVAFGALIVATISGLVWLWEMVSNWQQLDAPYSFFAAFYYFVIVVPLKTFWIVWTTLDQLELTEFNNMNLTISVLGVVAYAVIFFLALRFVSKKIKHLGVGYLRQIGILLLPLLLAGAWWLFITVGNWLFS
ncbi:hypothetical protein [Teredinibacter turnerae]|uniref:hypothetical protein n=1 Tax=Teredinibacter turnerae TaxID=2426 RepID=UPI00036F2B35|nr:hypothetical protein [Teredinibacter turnerae]